MIYTILEIKHFFTLTKFKNLLKLLEMDRAVFFGMLANIWGFLAGPVTMLLIAMKFSPEVQGYYYTFGNLLSFQKFVELGMGTVILQFASHEWSKLSLDSDGNIIGDKQALSRLIGISKIALKWYKTGCFIIMFALLIGGYIFFSGSPDSNIGWLSPWVVISFLTGINMLFVPVWSLLEGCNQVYQLYKFRFLQGVLVNVSIWLSIFSGANLWTIPIASFVSIGVSTFFLYKSYKHFVKTLLFSDCSDTSISWHKEMFPMQWRLALSWISGYLVFSFFTPVLFKYHGPVIAGQFGMTWTLISIITAITSSWISPRVPLFGILIAQKKYRELDKIFWKITKITVLLASLIAFSIWLLILVFNIMDNPLTNRFVCRILPPLPSGLFLIAQVLVVASLPFSSYLRAHKKEPIMHISVLSAIMVGLSTIILGKYYAATGMALGYLITHLIVVPLVFIIWHRKRLEWHSVNLAKTI